MDKTSETHRNTKHFLVFFHLISFKRFGQTNDYTKRRQVKHTPWCGEVCTSACECDRTPFLGKPEITKTTLLRKVIIFILDQFLFRDENKPPASLLSTNSGTSRQSTIDSTKSQSQTMDSLSRREDRSEQGKGQMVTSSQTSSGFMIILIFTCNFYIQMSIFTLHCRIQVQYFFP